MKCFKLTFTPYYDPLPLSWEVVANSIHKMFMNRIRNICWITSLVFTESGTDYNIAKDFGKVRIDTIEKDYQALEIATQPTDNIKK